MLYCVLIPFTSVISVLKSKCLLARPPVTNCLLPFLGLTNHSTSHFHFSTQSPTMSKVSLLLCEPLVPCYCCVLCSVFRVYRLQANAAPDRRRSRQYSNTMNQPLHPSEHALIPRLLRRNQRSTPAVLLAKRIAKQSRCDCIGCLYVVFLVLNCPIF